MTYRQRVHELARHLGATVRISRHAGETDVRVEAPVGHVWTTTSTNDGSEANQALFIPKGWISYFHSPVPCNVSINPTEGIAINRVLDRAYVTSGSIPGRLQVFMDDPTPPLVPFRADNDGIAFEVFIVE